MSRRSYQRLDDVFRMGDGMSIGVRMIQYRIDEPVSGHLSVVISRRSG